MGSLWKSHCGAEERKITKGERKNKKQQKEISGEGDGFCFRGVFKEGKLDF